MYSEQILLFLTLYSSKNQRKKYHVPEKNMKQHNSFNTHNKSAYYYDFWRSCDTGDQSNDAENTAFITEIHYILKYLNSKSILEIAIRFHNIIIFFCLLDWINTALMNRRDALKNIINRTGPKLWSGSVYLCYVMLQTSNHRAFLLVVYKPFSLHSCEELEYTVIFNL